MMPMPTTRRAASLDLAENGDVSENKARTKRVRAVGEDGEGYYHNAAAILIPESFKCCLL